MCIRDSLYTNVPIKKTITTLEQLLKLNNTPETHIKEIIHLTKIITEQNYFSHNNKMCIRDRYHSVKNTLFTSKCLE